MADDFLGSLQSTLQNEIQQQQSTDWGSILANALAQGAKGAAAGFAEAKPNDYGSQLVAALVGGVSSGYGTQRQRGIRDDVLGGLSSSIDATRTGQYQSLTDALKGNDLGNLANAVKTDDYNFQLNTNRDLQKALQENRMKLAYETAKSPLDNKNFETQQQIRQRYFPRDGQTVINMAENGQTGIASLPAELRGKILGTQALATRFEDLATTLDNLDPTYSEMQLGRVFSALDDGNFNASLMDTIDRYVRGRSGAAIRDEEMKLARNILAGDFTASPKKVSSLLRNAARNELEYVKNIEESSRLNADTQQKFAKEVNQQLERLTGNSMEGKTAVNPKTGVKIIFKNGKWENM